MKTMTKEFDAAQLPDSGCEELSEYEQLSNEELLRCYRETGDERLKWMLVLRFENLIRRIAQRSYAFGMGCNQLEDVIHEGILTLLSAVERFDPDKGVKLETYVIKRLRGIMIDLSRKEDWLPRQIRQRSGRVLRATDELTNRLGRMPERQEVADYLGMSREEYDKTLADTAGANLVSFEMLLDSYGSVSGKPVSCRDAPESPEAFCEEQELHEALAAGIGQLRPNEQMVLSLYYEKELTMKEIAEVMNISAPRVSQLHSRAVQKLREYLKEKIGR